VIRLVRTGSSACQRKKTSSASVNAAEHDTCFSRRAACSSSPSATAACRVDAMCAACCVSHDTADDPAKHLRRRAACQKPREGSLSSQASAIFQRPPGSRRAAPMSASTRACSSPPPREFTNHKLGALCRAHLSSSSHGSPERTPLRSAVPSAAPAARMRASSSTSCLNRRSSPSEASAAAAAEWEGCRRLAASASGSGCAAAAASRRVRSSPDAMRATVSSAPPTHSAPTNTCRRRIHPPQPSPPHT
jgi:hypothetical protein